MPISCFLPFLLARVNADQADITYKPVTGAKRSFQLVTETAADFGGSNHTIKATINYTITTGEVGDKAVEVTMSGMKVKVQMDGSDIQLPDQQGPSSVKSKVGLDGRQMVPKPGTSENEGAAQAMQTLPRAMQATMLWRPSAAIDLNAPFKVDIKGDQEMGTLDADAQTTVVGSEMVDGIDCWKVSTAYSEKTKDTPVSSVMTIWLSKADHDLVKSEGDVENYQPVQMMPPSHSHLTMHRVPNESTRPLARK